MDRSFSCASKHMARAIKAVAPTWRDTGVVAQTIRDFFKIVVPLREGNRFDVHGRQGKRWKAGDRIRFVVGRTPNCAAEAEVFQVVEGKHPLAETDTDRHFFLKDINLKPNSTATKP